MRSKIWQDPSALIAPGGLPNQARSPVAVEQAGGIEAAETARRENLAKSRDVRLEAVIVGGVADRPARRGNGLEPARLFEIAGGRVEDVAQA